MSIIDYSAVCVGVILSVTTVYWSFKYFGALWNTHRVHRIMGDILTQNIEYFDWIANLMKEHALLQSAQQLRNFVDFIEGEPITTEQDMQVLYTEWAGDLDDNT